MKVRFKKLLFVALLSSLFLGAGLLTGSTSPVATTAEASPALTSELQPLFPPFFSSAYFTGTWCYIDCSDQSFTTVRAFSTSHCCDECANFCSSGCIAEGQGPSVLCGAE